MLNLQGSTGMKEIVALLKQKAQEAEGVVAAKEKAERRAATATHRSGTHCTVVILNLTSVPPSNTLPRSLYWFQWFYTLLGAYSIRSSIAVFMQMMTSADWRALASTHSHARCRIHSGRLGRQYDRSLSRPSDREDGTLGWFSTPTAFGTQYTAHYKSSIPEKPEKELPISVVAFASTASDGFAIFYVTHLVYLVLSVYRAINQHHDLSFITSGSLLEVTQVIEYSMAQLISNAVGGLSNKLLCRHRSRMQPQRREYYLPSTVPTWRQLEGPSLSAVESLFFDAFSFETRSYLRKEMKEEELGFIIGDKTPKDSTMISEKDYRKGVIKGLYKGRAGGKWEGRTFVKVLRAYDRFVPLDDYGTPTDFSLLMGFRPQRLGRKEIVVTDVEEVFDLEAFDMTRPLVHFHSTEPVHIPVLEHTWFFRFEAEVALKTDPSIENHSLFKIKDFRMHLCPAPTCREMYMIDGGPNEIQRFCTHCKIWIHVRCMRKLDSRSADTSGSLATAISSLPVVRGQVGKVSEYWDVAGGYLFVEKFKDWLEKSKGATEGEMRAYIHSHHQTFFTYGLNDPQFREQYACVAGEAILGRSAINFKDMIQDAKKSLMTMKEGQRNTEAQSGPVVEQLAKELCVEMADWDAASIKSNLLSCCLHVALLAKQGSIKLPQVQELRHVLKRPPSEILTSHMFSSPIFIAMALSPLFLLLPFALVKSKLPFLDVLKLWFAVSLPESPKKILCEKSIWGFIFDVGFSVISFERGLKSLFDRLTQICEDEDLEDSLLDLMFKLSSVEMPLNQEHCDRAKVENRDPNKRMLVFHEAEVLDEDVLMNEDDRQMMLLAPKHTCYISASMSSVPDHYRGYRGRPMLLPPDSHEEEEEEEEEEPRVATSTRNKNLEVVARHQGKEHQDKHREDQDEHWEDQDEHQEDQDEHQDDQGERQNEGTRERGVKRKNRKGQLGTTKKATCRKEAGCDSQ
ncbi:hypothetical protein NP233_g11989 [Leucocoprinus birnbaumii]|uniref:Uncharacterized protein n=1 Tax=Leucocoprinus birnbaumii TaxID=56174 RepID=A0AAD5VHX0_9AGAR|nr:hypothetical protein NP233_g11989 [Leucocoprinus birnbaumii]